jgi:hypothetical protein
MIMQGRIHWGQAQDVKGSHRQHAYSDSWQIRVPFSYDGKMDLDAQSRIKNAISRKSSTGVYGKSYSVEVIDPVAKIIVVSVSLYIGD